MSSANHAPAGIDLSSVDKEALLAAKADVEQAYEAFKNRGLKLDLTRGKPSSEQLDLSMDVLSLPGEEFITPGGVDTRNYGVGTGIVELRELWADVLGTSVDNLIAADSSSLNIEFDLISWAFSFGTNDSDKPWSAEEGKLKWICPVPGYDRHHSITELFGFEMITVPMTESGPDMELVRELVKDPAVKGMWAVPVFSNPTGITFSRQTVEELAAMETGAADFRIMWDNAYAVHTLTDEFPEIIDVVEVAANAGNPNRFWAVSSTSKITLAGSGVSFFQTSAENLAWYNKIANVRGIGPNKVNQLAHYQFFGDAEGVRILMRKHAGILEPKFRSVVEILNRRLAPFGIAEWTTPKGGYFISVDLISGTAARVVELAKDAGVNLTAAGSTFPYLKDPQDCNLRLAPSMPPLEQVKMAMDGFATCVLKAAIEAVEN